MTDTLRAAAERAIDELIESARLLGRTEAKKGFGAYTQDDARFEAAWYEGISKHRATLRAALAAEQPQPPRFPTMLRKMWSGGEVQEWIDQHWTASPPPAAAPIVTDAMVEAACAAWDTAVGAFDEQHPVGGSWPECRAQAVRAAIDAALAAREGR